MSYTLLDILQLVFKMKLTYHSNAKTERKAGIRNDSGFTLLEAMVTLAVAGILAIVAVPGMTNVYLDNRRTTIVNDFFSTVQIARSAAITRNQRVAVCAAAVPTTCGGSWHQGVLVFQDTDRDAQLDTGEPVLHTIGAMDGMSITSTVFPTFLVYRPNGRAMVNNIRQNTGDIEICDHRGSTQSRVVIVDTSGRPRISKVDSAGVVPSC